MHTFKKTDLPGDLSCRAPQRDRGLSLELPTITRMMLATQPIAYELCQAADGRLLFQPLTSEAQGSLDLMPRDQAALFSLPPLYASLKEGRHLESQAKEAVDLLTGACGRCV